jgi:hypothetical protein
MAILPVNLAGDRRQAYDLGVGLLGAAIATLASVTLLACGSRTGVLGFDENPTEGGSAEAADGGPCPSGLVMLASGLDRPAGIAVDDVNVYFSAAGTIMRVPKCGGSPVTLANYSSDIGMEPYNHNSTEALLIDSTRVYWAVGAAIFSVPIEGGHTRMMVSVPDGIPAIALGTENVYFALGTEGAVGYVPLTADDRDSFWPLWGSQGFIHSLAIDSTSVYWTEDVGDGGRVNKLPLGGGPAKTTLASEPGQAERIAVDGTGVYFTNNGGGAATLLEVPLGGGGVTTLAAAPGLFLNVVVDSSHAYWVAIAGEDPNLGAILEVPIDGGEVTTLASQQASPAGLAVDETSVYWTAGMNEERRRPEADAEVRVVKGRRGSASCAIAGRGDAILSTRAHAPRS